MKLKKYRFDGGKPCKLKDIPTTAAGSGIKKAEALEKTRKNMEKIAALQDAFYADGREGLIVVLQALDAAGKDGTIKHVMTGLNPQGVNVHSFKQPNSEELSHDFLWRVNKCLPPRGDIAIFNRSHYEDVLVVQIHDIQKKYKMAERVIKQDKKEFFKKRYRQIRDYETYLYENSYQTVKIYLHLSPEAQKKRFLERIDRPEKNWKFSSADIEERKLFKEYQKLYQETIDATATPESPWYVVPADQKWFSRYLVSEIMVQALENCSHEYPDLPQPEKDKLAAYREMLENEQG